MKAKLNKEDYQFRKKTGQELIKQPGQLNGLDFVISNCEECTIYICDHAAQIFVDLSKNCKIYIGPVEGSIFVTTNPSLFFILINSIQQIQIYYVSIKLIKFDCRKCENIEISAASSQFRVSNSNNIQCFIYTQSDPALEKSTGITFAPYNFAYPGITEAFGKAKLDPANNKWSEVFDFTPNTDVSNWTLLHPSQFNLVSKSFEGLEEPGQCPVPIPTTYGGQCTKKIILGSADQKVSGLELDFLMGKENIKNQQQLADENHSYLETQLKSTNQNKSEVEQNQGNYEEFIFDQESVKSTEPQVNLQSQNTFNAFDELVVDNQSNKQNNQYLNQQMLKDEAERKLKEQKRKQAQEYLKKFMSDFTELTNQRKIQNRAIVREKVQKEEGWKTVISNINLKDNGGEKDVNQMAQAIKNRFMDVLK